MYNDKFDRKNVIVVCTTVVTVMIIVFTTIIVCYKANQAQEQRYKVACVQAGKSIISGDCIKVAS
jgi:hypothetical protein